MKEACCPDIKGSEKFEGAKVGGFDPYVHGKDGKSNGHAEKETMSKAHTGERKLPAPGGELHAKHYAHIK